MINKKVIEDAINVYGEHTNTFVSLTLKDADNFLDAIDASIGNKNDVSLAISAHSLKSIMLQAGSHEVADEALKLEKMGKSRDLTGASESLRKLKVLYTETKQTLRDLTKSRG